MNPIKSATEMVKQVRVSNILNCLVFLIPFLVAALIIASFGKSMLIQIFLIILLSATFTVLLFAFIYALFKDPGLLRSEKHIFNMRALEVLGDQFHKLSNFDDSPEENNPAEPNPETITIPEPKDIKKDI